MKFKEKYDIEKILNGDYEKWINRINNAKFDEKLAVIQLLLDYINQKIEEYNLEVDAVSEYKKLEQDSLADQIITLEKDLKENKIDKPKKIIRILQIIKENQDLSHIEENIEILKSDIIKYIENSLIYLEDAFGKSQELYLYLVNILNNVNIIMFISRNKVLKFFEYNSLLVNNSKNKEILAEIDALKVKKY